MLAVRLSIVPSFLFAIAISVTDVQPNKRILVSDSDFMQRLQDMELKMQSLTSRLSLLESVNATQSQKIQDLSAKVSAQDQTILNLSSQLTKLTQDSNKGGAVYVRWGKTECPDNSTELVYRGYAGGGLYTDTGSAAEYVCLPEHPVWGQHYDDVVNRNGKMYGAEYETSFFDKNYKAYYDDVPCAVCRSLSRSTSIMIPGRATCYQGWKQEYSGNLASGSHQHTAASQFVCVDENPEPVPHGTNNDNGKLFYAVEGICGSLSCPPYVNGRELSCVICTK